MNEGLQHPTCFVLRQPGLSAREGTFNLESINGYIDY